MLPILCIVLLCEYGTDLNKSRFRNRLPDQNKTAEETTEETTEGTITEEAPKTEGPADDTESDNSLPEGVSNDAETSADDSGYTFLNRPPSTEEEDANTEDEEKEKKKQAMYKEIDRIDEEARMQKLRVDFILNMDDPNYKPPMPCIGLTCPLTGEQYYID